jgi:hypothetical protein
MEPMVLFFYGVGSAISIAIHEIWSDYFGYTMLKMACQCCVEECIEEPPPRLYLNRR